MRWRAMALFALLLPIAGAAFAARQQSFPHERHAGLFPLCEGCHRGITSGAAAERFPSAQICTRCHDGVRERTVVWTRRESPPSNLRYDHVVHERRLSAAGETAACGACHGADAAPSRMAIREASGDACLACHAHQAPAHLSPGRDCTVCHVPLVRAAALPMEAIARFPQPPGHDAIDFGTRHAPDAGTAMRTCAVCHARESCARCHLNGNDLEAVRVLEPDRRVAELAAAWSPEYPRPPSHGGPEWSRIHGTTATSLLTCGNCHARSSCQVCHRERANATIQALPVAGRDDPRGVRLDLRTTRVHRDALASHAAEAAADPGTCASCHVEATCESCHAGPSAPDFHRTNYMQSHAADAYFDAQDCGSCHNAELFCRACHSGVGLAAQGNTRVAFHTANPAWLLGHGAAARQGLEGCVACHAQSTCTRCHSSQTGWRINPHGPGFDAERMREANPVMCRRCHRGGAERAP